MYGPPEDGYGEPDDWEIHAERSTVVSHYPHEGGGIGVRADADHIAHNDPAAVLRRVAADREVVDRHVLKPGEKHRICAECGGADWKPGIGHGGLDPYPWVMPWPCPTVLALARGLGINPETETPE